MKDVKPGRKVAFKKLHNPNTNPICAPAFLPSVIPAIITGICISVGFNGGIGINPSGVNTKTASMAKNIAIKARRFVFSAFFMFSPPTFVPLGYDVLSRCQRALSHFINVQASL